MDWEIVFESVPLILKVFLEPSMFIARTLTFVVRLTVLIGLFAILMKFPAPLEIIEIFYVI